MCDVTGFIFYSVTVMKILLFLSIFVPTTFVSSIMHRDTVSDALTRYAVCNDNSDAIYYIEKTGSSRWILFLESGGGCFDYDSCLARKTSEPYLFGSGSYPDRIIGEDVLSSSEKDNLFAGYNKVLIPYCSSDLWLGNNSLVLFSKGGRKLKVAFRGHQIFRAVIEDLGKQGLENATELWLVGSSAGGIGAANNARLARNTYQRLKVIVLTDSSWFINHQNMLSKLDLGKFLTSINGRLLPGCADNRADYPCCLSLFCMVTNGHFPKYVLLFNIISRYDIFALTRGIVMPLKITELDTTRKVISDMLSYGGEIAQTVRQTKAFSNVRSILVSCFQHAYLATSSLWSPGMLFSARSQTSFKLPSFLFRHSVRKGRWNNVAVNGETISSIIRKLYTALVSGKSPQTRNDSDIIGKSPSVIEDSCGHIQCNPTCPKSIVYYPSESNWPKWSQWLVLILYLSFTLICIFVKVFWSVRSLRESHIQNSFLSSLYDGANSLNAVGLPTCIPSNYIGLSCTDVMYSVNAEAHKRQMGDDGKPRWRHRFRCATNSKKERQNILNGVNAYFNPGQLIAIMGPSGCGKTTLLDILTGRKDSREAKVFINGLDSQESREWFKRHSGYMLQLGTPYYEELTVRENLTYSAIMRLPHTMSTRNKSMRVEQVIGQTGLNDYADVVVGKSIGPGLSGGQKRRLCVAIQLLTVPSVLFLDEPTSGLDSASSLELLATLHGLTLSGRLVILTIHQPRIEIFHMFDRILFLSNGQVAYFGSPIMAPTMIAEALKNSGELLDASNPADTIMDVLIFKKSQALIVDHYQKSGEIEAIKKAVFKATENPIKTLSMKVRRYPSSLSDRLLSFDCRASKCQTKAQKLYLLVIFLLYGLALGSVYWRTDNGILLMSCYQVFLCASQLFMASVIHAHFSKSIPVFALEQAEGVGKSYELVIHAFVRIAALTVLPLSLCSAIIYLCTVTELNLWKFFVTTIIHMQLNHVWISVVMFAVCATPRYSTLVCPMLSAVSGFAGGFLVPEPEMPIFYYWLFYINPTHWAYSSTMKVLINDVTFACEGRSKIECQGNMGSAILKQFGFHEVNPYRNMIIMIGLLVIFLFSTMTAVELRYTDKLKRWRRTAAHFASHCRQRFSVTKSCCTSPTHEKMQRLINEEDVEANGSCVKARDMTSLDNSIPTVNNNLRQHKNLDAVLDSDRLPLFLPVKVESMLTGRAAQKTRPKTISSFLVSEPPPTDDWNKGAALMRSNTFTYTGRPLKYQHKSPLGGDPSENDTPSSTSSRPTVLIDHDDHNDNSIRSDEERSRTESEVEPCMSKYLDSTPKQHEVYSSVFGNRPKSTRRRSVTKRLPDEVRRSESVHIQRQASMLILAERRKSMTLQIAGFGETFSYFNEICSDRRNMPRGHAALGVKKKIEAKKHQRASDASSRVSATDSVDLLRVADINASEDSIVVRRSRLLSQNAIDLHDDRSAGDIEDANNRLSNSSDSKFQVPSVKYPAENSILKKSSLDSRQDEFSQISIPRKFPSSVTEPVKVSALKISRKKLIPVREIPVNRPKFSENSETESRSSICRTPLGSIDEVEEENEYFDSQRVPKRGPGILKSPLTEVQHLNYFGEDRSEVAEWLQRNPTIFDEYSEQSDSDSTAKGSVIETKVGKPVDWNDAERGPEKYFPAGFKENYDTDEEVSAAFTAHGENKSRGGVKDTRRLELDGLRSNDSGICSSFIRIPDNNEENISLNEPEVPHTHTGKTADSFSQPTAIGITVTNPSPKTFSNAMYMIDSEGSDAVATLNCNRYESKAEKRSSLSPNPLHSSSRDSWKTRSNEEFFIEPDSPIENKPASHRRSRGASIRRSSSCEFEFDAPASIVDSDITKIRSLRRQSKKQKIETKVIRESNGRTKNKAANVNETVL